jgi:hypothetical protein
VERSDIVPFFNRPAQIHFGDDLVIRATVRQANAAQFTVTDEHGPEHWTPEPYYNLADVKWIRPWPPETPEERYLYDVVMLVQNAERVQWQENRYAVMIAAHRKGTTLHAEPGSLADGNEPSLTLSGPEMDDVGPLDPTPSDAGVSASKDPAEAARQIRRFMGVPPE